MVESIIGDPAAGITPPTRDDERASVELSLLLEALVRWSGHDFRDYAASTLKRRVAERMRAEDVRSISGLQERLLHDDDALRRFVMAMSTTSNRLLRPPEYFRAFRERVVPFLRTYSFVRLWFPAASTGEDVYSIAAILFEEGLLERCMIYATDLSELALAQARSARYAIGSPEEFAADYHATGGRTSISDFAEISEHSVQFREELTRQVIFSTHSLATDSSLNEFHCILARGVLSQFNKTLQFRVHNLFLQSLTRFGFVCLSSSESLHATPHEGAFRKIDETFPVYRRMR
ncbi:MAG TPA: CheR family methyltransferase [Candidatus Baltobacteraceae bacterium]|jgi:chemotaxis protein methyltransferase CheR|nr:CheR family methyltransferase [Candidatus Baltobacteraceae bacterium]